MKRDHFFGLFKCGSKIASIGFNHFKVDQILSTVPTQIKWGASTRWPFKYFWLMFILGNMLLNYESDFLLKMIKFGFALSVVVGFPLMIYPCRQSIFTLFLQKSIKYTSLNDSDSTYIPPSGKCDLEMTSFDLLLSFSITDIGNRDGYNDCSNPNSKCRNNLRIKWCPYGYFYRFYSSILVLFKNSNQKFVTGTFKSLT